MKFSELWLREWVNPAIDSDALANQITMAGLEVDGVEPVAGSFHGVVVGEVVECAQHPNADKLRVTKVNVGGDRLLDIVCGAPNCRQGLRVAVATIGAVLPGDFKIKAAKLRGEPSEGMLCSFSELGISDDHSGIIELPADAPIGTDIREYLKLDDNTIEISVTPNRADCLGIIGVARDVAVLNQLPLVEPEIVPVGATIDDTLPIAVEAPEACPRYLGRVVKGINVKAPTPLWMKEKLRRCGIRSIDAVVDVTNYVLLELGQPMHAFDKDRIEGGIVVRMAKEGETLVVAAATGPVGATVGQIGKLKGCRVVGVAGGAEKCRHATEVLGFDVCLDHHADDFAEQLEKACPKGIDIYYENVGGKVFDAVLPLLNTSARIPVCGLVSSYNATELPPGPDRLPLLMATVLKKRIRLQGFIIAQDYGHRIHEFQKEMGQWVKEDKIHYREEITDGLENAPQTFIGLLKGKNFGKVVIRVAGDD
ncbi:phenylalanine--tRNA ligase subunit beta [Escherichia coli]|nr:phenylalanine--tRNA ligase subunit beta [Escherichia coli]